MIRGRRFETLLPFLKTLKLKINMDYADIEYKGSKYPVRVSHMALKGLKADTGKTVEDLSMKNIELYESLFYHSLRAGAEYTGQPMTLKKEDMEKVLDACLFQFVGLIPQFFNTEKKS
jgi:hypothetical protein